MGTAGSTKPIVLRGPSLSEGTSLMRLPVAFAAAALLAAAAPAQAQDAQSALWDASISGAISMRAPPSRSAPRCFRSR